MKTPIVYYGGKQRMLEHILPLIPSHKKYVEPFAGGAAVFFAKGPSQVEVLGDINGNMANFYRVMKTRWQELAEMIDTTLHDEHTYKQARAIYLGKVEACEVKRAWAVWVGSLMSYGGKLFNHFQFTISAEKGNNKGKATKNGKAVFKKACGRLDDVMILEKDALIILKKYNQPDTFTYLDPPYFDVNQGHYEGYTRKDFIRLLQILKDFKGKFLLSSYESDVLEWFTKRYGWNTKKVDQCLGVKGTKQRKIEVLTGNYQFENTLF